MKSSLALVLAGSLLAAASPIDKRAIYTNYVTDVVWVTVTVTAGEFGPIRSHYGSPFHQKTKTTAAAVTTTSTSSSSTSTSTSTSTTPTSTSTTPISTSTTPSTTPAAVTTPVYTTPVYTTPVAETPVAETPVAETPATTSTTPVVVETKPVEENTVVAAPAAKTSTSEAATVVAQAASAATPTDFASTAVWHHNKHRANHSAPSITYSDELAEYAAQVAASCKFAHDLTPGGGGYGQNLAMIAGTDISSSTSTSDFIASSITNMWYNGEVALYPDSNYGSADPDMSEFESWGHFSQVVWKETTEVGCAVQFCAKGSDLSSSMNGLYSVCNYRQAGNVGTGSSDSGYAANVLPPLKQATYAFAS